MNFEEWFKQQGFYFKFLYLYGSALFIKDGDVYRNFYVDCIYEAYHKDKAKPDKVVDNKTVDWIAESTSEMMDK